MKHLDYNGRELAVGDAVRYGDREGTVLILEEWTPSDYYPVEGLYVSGIGYWGGCLAVPACQVVKP